MAGVSARLGRQDLQGRGGVPGHVDQVPQLPAGGVAADGPGRSAPSSMTAHSCGGRGPRRMSWRLILSSA